VRSLAINSNGDIFAGADFINGAGGVFRSVDNGESWVEVNGGVISTDVRALAINANGDIFAGAYPDGGVFRSTDNGESWTPIDNGLTCKNVYSLAINPAGDIFVGTAGCGAGVFRSTDNGDHWTLVNNGLTSTDVPALAINAEGHIFAGTQSQFGEGGGIFRSLDNGDTWTEQDDGFTALDVNALAIDSSGHIFAGAAGGAFLSTNDGENWSDISSGLIPAGGNVWTIAIDSAGTPFSGTAGGGVFRGVQETTAVCPLPSMYWRNNIPAWPVTTLTLGGQSYDQAELLAILTTRIGAEGETDVSLILAHQLIGAKLNLANGSDPAAVGSTIEDADALLSRFSGKLPYSVKRSLRAGQAMFKDATVLTDYNHGTLTPGCGP
jgi:hypothetical protein